MKLADQPHTPREAYEALIGKRPDLLLTEKSAARIRSVIVACPNSDGSENFLIVAIIQSSVVAIIQSSGDCLPRVLTLGGIN